MADLAQELALIWERLALATSGRAEPFRTPCLSTVSRDGRPQARTVVLRSVKPRDRLLEIHTDTVAEKCRAVSANPYAAFCFWDPKRRLQLRLTGSTTMLGADETDDILQSMTASARKIYGISPPPASVIETSNAFGYRKTERFAVIQCQVSEMDALWLSRPKHKRLKAEWVGERWLANWVVP